MCYLPLHPQPVSHFFFVENERAFRTKVTPAKTVVPTIRINTMKVCTSILFLRAVWESLACPAVCQHPYTLAFLPVIQIPAASRTDMSASRQDMPGLSYKTP